MSDGRNDYSDDTPRCLLHSVPCWVAPCIGCNDSDETDVVPIYQCRIGYASVHVCMGCARKIDTNEHPWCSVKSYYKPPLSPDAAADLRRDVNWEE